MRTPLYDQAGREILPVGSQVVGHVAALSHSGAYHGNAALTVAVDGLNVFGTFVPISARVSDQSSLQSRRSGILQRQNATLPAGSDLILELQGPVSVAQLARAARLEGQGPQGGTAAPPTGVGGGPGAAGQQQPRGAQSGPGAQCPGGDCARGPSTGR